MRRRALLLFIFALLSLTPLLGLMTGLAQANTDVPTPSGSYTLTTFGSTQEITLNCTNTICDFSGFGVSLTLSRTIDFSEITSRWDRDNKVMVAGGRIRLSGRFHPTIDPEYPSISRYWIPSTVGNFQTSGLETRFRDGLARKGGTLQDPIGVQTSPDGSLLLHWIAPRLFFNLSWNGIDPTANCFANVNGCANTQIGVVTIGGTTTTTSTSTTTTTTTSTSTTTSTTTTTTLAPTTTEAATTTIAATETTVLDSTSTLPEVSTTISTSQEPGGVGEQSEDESGSAFVTPYRQKPISSADTATTLVATVAGLSTVVAAGAALSGATMLSTSTIGGGPVPGPGPVQGSNPSAPRSGPGQPPDRIERPADLPRNPNDPSSTEVASTMFTTEHLDRAESESVTDVAKPPLISQSRILSRIFYDTGLLNALCMLMPLGPAAHAARERPEPRLTRVSFLLSLLIPLIAGSGALLMPDVVEPANVAILTILLFMMGWLSALHGLLFAVVWIALDLIVLRNGFDLLGVALMIVVGSFAPLLACTLIQPHWYGSIDAWVRVKLFGAFGVMFVISLKLSQELQQQMAEAAPNLLSWPPPLPIVLPAFFGAITPPLRFMAEFYLRRNNKSDARQGVSAFLNQTAQLRRGEILNEQSVMKRVVGLLVCVVILGFIVHAYTDNNLGAMSLICLAFVLIALLHFPSLGSSAGKGLHELIPLNLSKLPGLPSSAKLFVPTVSAMSIGILVNLLSLNSQQALWVSVGFSYFVFVFELYDVKTTRSATRVRATVRN